MRREEETKEITRKEKMKEMKKRRKRDGSDRGKESRSGKG